MKTIIVLISLFIYSMSFSQKNNEQLKIYIKLEIDSSCFRKQKFYSNEEKGIIINNKCLSGDSFLFSDKSKADTICMSKLNKYKISSIDEIKKTEKKWRKEKFKEVQEKNKKEGKYTLPIHTFDKNYIFKTYIIEVISEEKFILYPVMWRGEGIKQ